MGLGSYTQVFGGWFPLGSAKAFLLEDLNVVTSNTLNARDLGSVGNPDFASLVPPGSQASLVSYTIAIAKPATAPTDALGLRLRLNGSFDDAIPVAFIELQRILLPVYDGVAVYNYSGRARLETPAALFSLVNLTGVDLTIDYGFFAKVL